MASNQKCSRRWYFIVRNRYAFLIISTDNHSNEVLSVNYRKWELVSQTILSDIEILGSSDESFLSPLSFHTITGQINTQKFSARYIGVGKPMVCFYAATEPIHTSTLATSMATKVTTVVTK